MNAPQYIIDHVYNYVVEWLYSVAGGIKPVWENTGFQEVIIARHIFVDDYNFLK